MSENPEFLKNLLTEEESKEPSLNNLKNFVPSKIHSTVLSWENIGYTVIDSKSKVSKEILKGVSGYAKPGEILAIMGPSGSGKTTLLNVIGARTVSTAGNIRSDGVLISGDIKNDMGYVAQNDFLFPTLTARESLITHAQLRLPSSLKKEIPIRVDQLLETLGLTKVADSYVGNETLKGMSGGEKKRVSIGCELIHEPSILLLDEPTSGLDSTTAFQVVCILRELAKRGHTIICTIHQPRKALFDMMDRILLLSGGQVFYFGERESAFNHFAMKGFKCPEFENPADFFIDVLSGVYSDNEERNKLDPSTFFQEREPLVFKEGDLEKSVLSDLRAPQEYMTSAFDQFYVLSIRAFRNEMRQPLTSFVSLSQTVFIAAIICALYFNLSDESPDGIQNRSGALFFIVINQAFSTLASLRLFVAEVGIFSHEKNSNMYRTSAYFFSKCLSELPMKITEPLVFSSIVYFALGLNTNGIERFFVFVFIIFLVSYNSASLAVCLGALVSNAEVAQVLVPVMIAMLLLFGGNSFIVSSSIPVYFSWIQYVSFFHYATNAILINEFQGLHFKCSNEEKSCTPDGATYLKNMGLHDSSLLLNVVYLILLPTCLRFAAYIFLRFKHTPITPRHDENQIAA